MLESGATILAKWYIIQKINKFEHFWNVISIVQFSMCAVMLEDNI